MFSFKSPLITSLRVKAKYDDNFKRKFGSDAVNAARRILAHAQNLWLLRDSLTTVVRFIVDPNVYYIPGQWASKTDMYAYISFSSVCKNQNISIWKCGCIRGKIDGLRDWGLRRFKTDNVYMDFDDRQSRKIKSTIKLWQKVNNIAID